MAGNLIREFLLQPGIYEVLSFERFKEFVPERMRNHPDVYYIYKAFRKKRHILQKQIDAGLQREYQNESLPSVTKQPKDFNTLLHTVTEMEKKKMELEMELKKITREGKDLENAVDQSLENLQLFHEQFVADSAAMETAIEDINRILHPQ